jgi:hypothetical protein
VVREENVAKTCFVLRDFREGMDSRSYRKLKPDKTGGVLQSAVLVGCEIAIRARKWLLRDEGATRPSRQSGTNLE